MFFRFGSALVLAIFISLGATTLEKRNLELRRRVSRQYFRKEALLELYTAKRLAAQQSGAPQRLIEKLESESQVLKIPPETAGSAVRKKPQPPPQKTAP